MPKFIDNPDTSQIKPRPRSDSDTSAPKSKTLTEAVNEKERAYNVVTDKLNVAKDPAKDPKRGAE